MTWEQCSKKELQKKSVKREYCAYGIHYLQYALSTAGDGCECNCFYMHVFMCAPAGERPWWMSLTGSLTPNRLHSCPPHIWWTQQVDIHTYKNHTLSHTHTHTTLIHKQYFSELLIWQWQAHCGCNRTQLVYKLCMRQLGVERPLPAKSLFTAQKKETNGINPSTLASQIGTE